MTSENADTAKDDLTERARKDIEELPAETALGNKDPLGGGTEDPKTYEDEHTSTTS